MTYKETHEQKLLRLLRENPLAGVNSYDATYVYGMKQAPARIKGLKKNGFVIDSIKCYDRPKKSVNWVLIDSPIAEVKKEPRIIFRGNTAVYL